jgi:hypothetical protein
MAVDLAANAYDLYIRALDGLRQLLNKHSSSRFGLRSPGSGNVVTVLDVSHRRDMPLMACT